MSIKIKVESSSVNVKEGVGKRGAYRIREQEVWAIFHNKDGSPQPHPTRCVINLDDNQEPHPVGEYTLAPTSFFQGDFGAIRVSPKLVPLRPVAARAA